MKNRAYKIFRIDEKGVLRLFNGTNFKSDGEAWKSAVEARTDDELVVLMVLVNPKDL